MKLSAKVIVTIVILGLMTSSLLLVQCSSSTPKTVKLTTHDMEVIFKEMLPPQQQQQIASNPEERKKLVEEIRKLLALAQVAEQEGYAQRPALQSQLALTQDRALNEAYRKKNPDAKATDEEINAYHLANPKEFDDFLAGNPRAAQQAQGPQREELRKQLGEFKVIAARARKEGMDKEDVPRLQALLARSETLARAYVDDLKKNADSLVTDADIEQYYNEHPAEFDEVRVRHILVSTQPNQEDDHGDGKDKKPADKPKTPTKEEARAKAQALLERARKGEDFARLATENSDDPGSKEKGGEYDFFGRGRMVPEFDTAAFALKPGEISDLVETQFGFHIIKLEERRSAASPATDQKVRQLILEKVKQEKLEARINDIAQNSDVVVPEDFDTTPKAAAAPQRS